MISIHRFALRLVATLLLACASTASLADDGERETLARLAHEIETLRVLVDEAESHADTGARIRFRYDWLRADLARVRQGILDHAQADRAEPREVPPLRGDYRR
ncbi:MAG: RAQPRD family integrative conjugative element protein [Candidatus Sedimenticola endophacoides]